MSIQKNYSQNVLIIMKQLKYLIIHCSDTPISMHVSGDTIRKWHLEERGWKQVGYSDILHQNGQIENLVEYDEDEWVQANEITNGAFGMNSVSRHICVIGGRNEKQQPKDTLNALQEKSLTKYCHDFINVHPDALIAGHYHFSKKTCPNFNVEEFCKRNKIPNKNIQKLL